MPKGPVINYTEGERGAEQVLAMLKGGTKGFGVALTRVLEVLAILKVGAKSFQPLIKDQFSPLVSKVTSADVRFATIPGRGQFWDVIG